jgi:hypothetical protein
MPVVAIAIAAPAAVASGQPVEMVITKQEFPAYRSVNLSVVVSNPTDTQRTFTVVGSSSEGTHISGSWGGSWVRVNETTYQIVLPAGGSSISGTLQYLVQADGGVPPGLTYTAIVKASAPGSTPTVITEGGNI